MVTNDSSSKALKAGIGYTIGNVFIKGITFISIPIFARLLSVGDYGIVNTCNAYVAILSIFIGFALHSSIKNAKIDYANEINQYVSSLILLILFNSIFFLLIAILFSSSIARYLSLKSGFLVALIVMESFGSALISYYNCVLAIDYKFKEYIKISLLYSISNMLISIVFIMCFFQNTKWLGRILGTVVSSLLVTALILFRIFRRSMPKVNKGYWKYGLQISLPIIPHGLSQIVLAQFDRLMINSVIGSVEAGLYSFAYNIGTIFQVIVNSLDTAWTQWFFEQMHLKNYIKIRKVASVYCGIVTCGTVALMLISPELILLMGGKKYIDSSVIAFPVLFSMYLSFLYYFPASVEYYYKKTNFIAVATMSAAVLNIILNAIFIPLHGYIAAAYTTVFCYSLYYIFHLYLSKYIHGSMVYDLKNQFLCLSIVAIVTFICILLRNVFFFRYLILSCELVLILIVLVKNKEILLSYFRMGKH